MPKTLRLAVSQSRTLHTLEATLSALRNTARTAAARGVDLVLFPEALLGGYPRGCSFGATVGSRSATGRDQFLHYFKAAVDLGDVPDSRHSEAWLKRTLPLPERGDFRGDGTREELEDIARETGVFLAVGCVERAGGSLYCAVVFVDPVRGTIGKRRKVMPTGSERLVWAQGSPSTLKAVVAYIRGIRVVMGAAICWESYMPLLRTALYSQDINLYLAPTADARDAWASLMRTVACEGRCFVLSANMCVKKKDLPHWIEGSTTKGKSPREPQRSSSVKSAIRTAPKSETRRRRSSIIVKADDHELVLPVISQPETLYHVRSASLLLEERGHHLLLPATDDTQTHGHISEEDLTAGRNDNAIEDDEQEQDHEPPGQNESEVLTPRPADPEGEEFACRGGSCIMGPLGDVLAEPLWEVDEGGLLIVDADFEDCERGRLDLDVAGSYSRNDAFRLTVEGLDLNPPP